MVIAQSFAKTMGLYGERTGALHFVCADKTIAGKVLSQLKIVIRVNYSSPPKHGARIAGLILSDLKFRQQWLDELVTVTGRMDSVRKLLRAELERIGTKGTWDHITTQRGMFAFTGLSVPQSKAMVAKHSIYMTNNGRISVAGLTTKNIAYVAESIKNVTDTL
jgi:aspartate aminotransferase